MLALVGGAVAFFHLLDGVGDVETFDEDVAVDVADAVDALLGESTALEAEGVHAAVLDGVAGSFDEGWHVLVDEGTSLGDDVGADMDELQAGCLAAEDDVIAHDDMSGEGGVIGKYAVVAYDTVVGYMDVSHEEVAVADDGLAAGGGATVNGAAFADGVVVANLDGGVFAGELEILRHGSDDSTGEDAAVLADAGAGEDGYVGTYPGAVAYFNIFADSGKVRDFDVLANLGVGV